MAFGRKLTIYLSDGSPLGIRHVEIANWTGQAIASPRARLGELSKWEETKKPGVYFLFENHSTEIGNKVYIGESENVIKRVTEHDRGKDFWNEVVIFSSKDENLTKAHVKYLESKLLTLAIQAGRCIPENSNSPIESSLPRSDRDWLDEFIHNLKIILGTLGHKILENITPTEPINNTDNSLLGIELTFIIKNIIAKGQPADEGFILLKNSQASLEESSSLLKKCKEIRDTWIENKTLIIEGNHYLFTKDAIVSSSSYAAAIIAGTSRSGPLSWLDSSGKSLKSIEEQILKNTSI